MANGQRVVTKMPLGKSMWGPIHKRFKEAIHQLHRQTNDRLHYLSNRDEGMLCECYANMRDRMKHKMKRNLSQTK
jgi:hypothetical protein